MHKKHIPFPSWERREWEGCQRQGKGNHGCETEHCEQLYELQLTPSIQQAQTQFQPQVVITNELKWLNEFEVSSYLNVTIIFRGLLPPNDCWAHPDYFRAAFWNDYGFWKGKATKASWNIELSINYITNLASTDWLQMWCQAPIIAAHRPALRSFVRAWGGGKVAWKQRRSSGWN